MACLVVGLPLLDSGNDVLVIAGFVVYAFGGLCLVCAVTTAIAGRPAWLVPRTLRVKPARPPGPSH